MRGTGQGAQLEVARIQSEINRLFDMLLRLKDSDADGTGFTPAVDVAEADEALIVEADLPGVDPGSLELEVRDGQLVLRGERPLSLTRSAQGAEVLHDEREFGPFEVSIPLNVAVNSREAIARAAAGLLRIEMPKIPNRRGNSVSIPVEVVR